ncbi:MAG TPA: tetratricopeptide repeat protein [Usitatibacter sp.]|nr:tetratricopeptide repeat protein [Usitatibacter sp.]
MSADALQAAQESHRKGLFRDAIAGYATFLDSNPGRGDVWHMRAVAEHQSGALDASLASIGHATEASGEQPATMLLRGMVLQDRGDLEGAQQSFARAAELRAGWAPPLANRAQALLDLGRPAEALEVLRAAAALDSSNPRVWNNMGLALLTLDRVDESLKAFNHSLSIAPLPAAHYNVARIHHFRDEGKLAFEHAREALRLDPRFFDAHLLLGDLYHKRRDAENTQKSYFTATQIAPNNARVRNAYAEYLSSAGRIEEAREEYRHVARMQPGDLRAAFGSALLLPAVYRSGEDVDRWRAEYAAGLDALRDSAERFRFRTPRETMLQARWTNFFLAYQGREDLELQRGFGTLMNGILGRNLPAWMQPRKAQPARAKMRVGFCSHFFFNCTAGRYFASWVTRLDRSRFETFVYYTNERVADDTRAIMAASDKFRHIAGRSFDVVARAILDDELDALVFPELGMHGETFSLASLRLAPVQATGWGHPTTTGLPNVDYFLSSGPMEPGEGARHYSEELVRLPGLGTHYVTPAVKGEAARADFGLPGDAVLYLVPQSMFKILPDNDELLARVMEADPRGKLVFFGAQHNSINAAFQARLVEAFSKRGLSFSERSILLPFMQHAEYLLVNTCCDVMLDTFHWSGGNTSLDAIAAGLPVVTLPGDLMRGRQSAAMLRMLGIEELIAKDADDYVAKAVAIANDRAMRATLSGRMKAGHGLIFNRDEPIRALEGFLETAIAKSRSASLP